MDGRLLAAAGFKTRPLTARALQTGGGGDIEPNYNLNFLSGTLPPGLTYTNSSTTRQYFGSNGLLQTAAANVPIFEYDPVTLALRGMRWEMEARTNLALWNRDLTNAAWVKTLGTAAKNQAGLGGVANSASSFTATSANATCLQSITSASAARTTSFYLKRITGTGQVDITQDNGTTWTTVALTSAWQRFQVTATAANPILGVRVVVSGDAVALDYAQHETPASGASSPIATTTAAVTRAADSLTANSISPWYRQDQGTIVFEGIASEFLHPTDSRALFAVSDGTINNCVSCTFNSASGAVSAFVRVGGVTQAGGTTANAATLGAVLRIALAYQANNFGHALNGGTVVTDTAGTVPTVTTLQLGKVGGVTQFMGYGRRFTYYPTRLANSQIQGASRV